MYCSNKIDMGSFKTKPGLNFILFNPGLVVNIFMDIARKVTFTSETNDVLMKYPIASH